MYEHFEMGFCTVMRVYSFVYFILEMQKIAAYAQPFGKQWKYYDELWMSMQTHIHIYDKNEPTRWSEACAKKVSFTLWK